MVLFVWAIALNAQTLKFSSDGRFKISQLTDTHYYLGGEKSQAVLDNLKVVAESERPDLFVLTGDIVTARNNTIESWKSLTEALEQYNTPYLVVFGNHDDEGDRSRKEIYDYLRSRKLCLIADADNVSGVANYSLPIYSSKGSKEAFVLYAIDSKSYSTEKGKGVEGYGWIGRDQINWFAATNEMWKSKNEDIKGMMFFHIPLPEYRLAWEQKSFRKGMKGEDECAPEINTGMFAEMLLQGNVLGAFVGHDHNNNYVAQYYGIILGYGAYSGGNTYFDLRTNGSRIIELQEGAHSFKSWIRYSDKSTDQMLTLPPKISKF